MKAAFWTVVVVALCVYLAMVGWSIPRISAAAGGLPPFDMRPGGYRLDEARTFLAALTDEGEDFYRRVQLRLDLLYPALLAAATGWAFLRLAPRRRWRWALVLVAIAAMTFDFLENAAIARMLDAGSDGLTSELVARASAWSQLKAAATMVSLSLLLVLLLLALLRRRRTRRNIPRA